MKGKEKKEKKKRVRTVKVGKRRKTVLFLWVLLIGSVVYSVYNNFTAVDMHTVHEKKIVREKLVDTNSIENFIHNFVKTYYTWTNEPNTLAERTKKLEQFLTGELMQLNMDSVRSDIPTSSTVSEVLIWKCEKIGKKNFDVTFSVEQVITEGLVVSNNVSYFSVRVYVGSKGGMVIVKNPAIVGKPKKSPHEPEAVESDVDAIVRNEVDGFLNTFFKLYPTASKEELAYYVDGDVLGRVGKDYVFAEIVKSAYIKDEDRVKANVVVKYLDQRTKANQLSQFELVLKKGENGNWRITE